MTRDRRTRGADFGWLWIAVVATFLSFGQPPASAQELNRCVRAWVAYPIVLPDDSTHDPGVLELCLRGKNPVNGRHEVRVNGMPIGQWPSRIGRSEEMVGGRPLVVLAWTADGKLQLIGYASPERGSTVTYLLDSYAAGEDLNARGPTLQGLLDGPDVMMLLADAGR